MVVAEAWAGLNALKSAFDMLSGFKDIHDATERDRVVLDLQRVILTAQEEQSKLLDRIRELEKELGRFETWEREKQRYELKQIGFGAFAYMLKESERGTEPATWICTNCYEHGRKATIQCKMEPENGAVWTCPSCKNTFDPALNEPEWDGLDGPPVPARRTKPGE